MIRVELIQGFDVTKTTMKEKHLNFTQSVILHKCPKCRKGKLFTTGPYKLSKFTDMYEKCECCGQKFELEHSFYYGAMYVSYALQVALFTAVWLAFTILKPDVEYVWRGGAIIAVVILMLPVTLRLSRSLWIHFFVKFDKNKTC